MLATTTAGLFLCGFLYFPLWPWSQSRWECITVTSKQTLTSKWLQQYRWHQADIVFETAPSVSSQNCESFTSSHGSRGETGMEIQDERRGRQALEKGLEMVLCYICCVLRLNSSRKAGEWSLVGYPGGRREHGSTDCGLLHLFTGEGR